MNRDTLVRPYMLFNEQLFRFEIYRTCDGNYLFLDLHHIVADGTSLAIIINDINRAYSGEKLEPEGYTSYDLALDNRDALAGDIYKNAENYYKSVFEHAGGSISFYPDKNGAAPTAELRYVVCKEERNRHFLKKFLCPLHVFEHLKYMALYNFRRILQ